MCGGGKGVQQTSQQTAFPSWPAATGYSTAMDRISQATSQPFQKYSSDPEAYVASLTPTQTGAIQNVTGLQGMTDPYYRAAGALTMAGAAPVNRLTSGQIQEYMNPYMAQVVDPVQNALRQQFGMQQTQQQAQAIKSGAFGGERAGVERALLRGQQGLALGQALSPLYQTGYGQALQTAQGQQGVEAANLQRLLGAGAQAGGLGTAAQQAALQQASAQLQAGTLEQQTQTAQKQALYNEFQKQRMYPLQTAQLYAQTAGALGPLMGSTSMGYQQMPFFGGFAADGGAIKGYDEGLGAARMGGAVEEAGDYARGGYAHGGIGAHLQYTDMTDPNAAEKRKMDNLLASQQASLMAGLDTSGTEFPTGEMRPGRLLEASGLPERRQGIVERGLKAAVSDPSGTYEKAKGLGQGLKTGYKFLSEGPGALMGFAAGGDVHNDAMSDLLNNPIQVAKPQQAQHAPQQQKSGLGGLLKAGASLAANMYAPGSGPLVSAGLGALGMADGGRAGYEEGGPTEGDFFKRGIQGAESAHRQFDKYGRTLTSPKGAEGISQIMPGTGPEAAKLAGLPYDRQRLRSDEEYNTALGQAYFNKQLKDFGTEELAAAAYNAGPGRVRQALARAEREGGDVMSYLPAETRAYVPTAMRKAGLDQDTLGRNIAGLGSRERAMMALYPDRPTTEAPGSSAGLGSAQVKDESFMERTERHPESLILPVLQGLGAMAGSKNRYALGALAEGLGAGAGSYMEMQGKQSEIDKRRQETATEAEETAAKRNLGMKIGEETIGQRIANLRNSLYTSEFGNFVFLQDGSVLPLDSYISALDSGKQPQLAGAVPQNAREAVTQYVASPTPITKAPGTTEPAPGTPPSEASKFTQPKVDEKLPIGVVYDDDSARRAKEAARLIYAGGPASANARKDSETYRADVTQQAQNARNNSPFIDELATSLADVYGNTGAGMAGWKAGSRAKALSMANFLYRNLGGKEDLSSLPSNSEVVAKIQQLLAGQSASGLNQDSYAALSAIKDAIPNLEMSPDAGAKLMAELMVIRKKSMDREAHMNRWNRDARGNLQGAGQDFRDKHREAEYKKSQDIIAYIMKQDPATFKRLMSGSLTAQEIEDFIHSPKKPDGSGGFGAKAPDGISEFFPTVDRVQRTTAPGRP
jgi:hypothetical protein